MLIETESWPYNFPMSEDYPYAEKRGIVTGRLLVRDRYILLLCSNINIQRNKVKLAKKKIN